jgi:phage/plasmid primase-like uncharacterized protein
MSVDAISSFEEAIAARGLLIRGSVVADGNIHICDVAAAGTHGKGDGRYLLHPDDPPAGWFQNWRDGLGPEKWRGNGTARKPYAEEVAVWGARRRQREGAEQRAKEEVSKESQEIWTRAGSAPADHPYLSKKGIGGFAKNLRADGDGKILVPLRDSDGKLWNLQRIDRDGNKLFPKGGRVKGLYSAFGQKLEPEGTVVIAEGMATAASITEATKLPVAAAMYAGNLLAVGKALREKFPKVRIVYFADHDKPVPGQKKGIECATEAAKETNGFIAISPTPGDDANDLYAREGAEAVQAAIDAILPAPTTGDSTTETDTPLPPPERILPEDTQEDSLEFPCDVITGAAGRFTWIYEGIVESPPQFTYMAYLTCLGAIASGSLTLKTHLKTQPRLFTIMLAKSGSGRKSSGNQNVTDFFKTVYDKFGWCGGVGSAEGLQKNLINKPKLLLDFDEMKVFVSKCAADSSVLLPCVNTLFEKNVYENHTKKESVRLEGVHLSFLAASTLATYSNAWSSSFTDIGFNNRLFLVTGDSERKYSIPRVIDGKVHYELRRDLEKVIAFIQENPVMDVTPEAFERYDYWYKHPAKSEHATRLDAYALRLMLLLAVNDMKPIVDLETVEKVIKLCDHQLLVRKAHDPVDADNQIAVLEEKIRRNLATRGTLAPRELKKYTNANRTGIQLFQKAIANLLAENEISQDKDLRYTLKDFS